MVGVNVRNTSAVGGKQDIGAVGRKHRLHVDRAVAGKLTKAAGLHIHNTNIAIATTGPSTVHNLGSIRGKPWGISLIEARTRHECSSINQLVFSGKVSDTKVRGAVVVDDKHHTAPVGANVWSEGTITERKAFYGFFGAGSGGFTWFDTVQVMKPELFSPWLGSTVNHGAVGCERSACGTIGAHVKGIGAGFYGGFGVEYDAIKARFSKAGTTMIDELRVARLGSGLGWDKSWVMGFIAVERNSFSFPKTAFENGFELGGVVFFYVLLPCGIKLFVRSTGEAIDMSIDAKGNYFIAGVGDDGRKQAIAVDINNPLQELRTV